jgi:hypothetical protein
MLDYEGNLSLSPKLTPGADGTITVPAPAGTVRPAGPQDTDADGHLVLFDSIHSLEYDYWQATTAADTDGASLGGGQPGNRILAAGTIDRFDIRGLGANADGLWSARATGTPLLAGLLLPEDIERGVIDHALAFAIPGPRNTAGAGAEEPSPNDFYYPTSTTETDYFNTNPLALAAGQRIRLKASLVDENGNHLDENQLTPITRMFLTSLRTYGAYLVDNAGGLTFYAEDVHTAVLHLTLDEINRLTGRPAGTPLPEGQSGWRLVMETLNRDLERIPLAHGPWQEGQNPATATVSRTNFEVMAPATR